MVGDFSLDTRRRTGSTRDTQKGLGEGIKIQEHRGLPVISAEDYYRMLNTVSVEAGQDGATAAFGFRGYIHEDRPTMAMRGTFYREALGTNDIRPDLGGMTVGMFGADYRGNGETLRGPEDVQAYDLIVTLPPQAQAQFDCTVGSGGDYIVPGTSIEDADDRTRRMNKEMTLRRLVYLDGLQGDEARAAVADLHSQIVDHLLEGGSPLELNDMITAFEDSLQERGESTDDVQQLEGVVEHVEEVEAERSLAEDAEAARFYLEQSGTIDWEWRNACIDRLQLRATRGVGYNHGGFKEGLRREVEELRDMLNFDELEKHMPFTDIESWKNIAQYLEDVSAQVNQLFVEDPEPSHDRWDMESMMGGRHAAWAGKMDTRISPLRKELMAVLGLSLDKEPVKEDFSDMEQPVVETTGAQNMLRNFNHNMRVVIERMNLQRATGRYEARLLRDEVSVLARVIDSVPPYNTHRLPHERAEVNRVVEYIQAAIDELDRIERSFTPLKPPMVGDMWGEYYYEQNRKSDPRPEQVKEVIAKLGVIFGNEE